MNRFTTKPATDATETAASKVSPGAEPSPPPAESSLGWNVALSIWVVGFIVLVMYELWNFLFPLVRGLFR